MDLDIAQIFQTNSSVQGQGKRMIHPLPKNPADRATIVSVFPRTIIEVKPTIFPSRFEIPAAEKDDFSILVIESASYFKPSHMERMPPTEIQINAAELAKSLINDYLGAMWLSSMGARCPGIFWIPGQFNKTTIVNYKHSNGKTFSQMLEDARTWQKNWFVEMVNAADTFWAKSHGDPKSIPDDARLAVEYLQIPNKPWMENVSASLLDNCPACGEMINKAYPVCKYCHAVIDTAKAKELDLQFAKG